MILFFFSAVKGVHGVFMRHEGFFSGGTGRFMCIIIDTGFCFPI